MREVLKALLTIWYLIWSCVFLFGVMVSVFVFLGTAGTDHGEPLIGLFTGIVFWWASSTYRKKFLDRMEEVQKKTDNHEEDENDDEGSSDDTI
jgi:amino acid permease